MHFLTDNSSIGEAICCRADEIHVSSCQYALPYGMYGRTSSCIMAPAWLALSAGICWLADCVC